MRKDKHRIIAAIVCVSRFPLFVSHTIGELTRKKGSKGNIESKHPNERNARARAIDKEAKSEGEVHVMRKKGSKATERATEGHPMQGQ